MNPLKVQRIYLQIQNISNSENTQKVIKNKNTRSRNSRKYGDKIRFWVSLKARLIKKGKQNETLHILGKKI